MKSLANEIQLIWYPTEGTSPSLMRININMSSKLRSYSVWPEVSNTGQTCYGMEDSKTCRATIQRIHFRLQRAHTSGPCQRLWRTWTWVVDWWYCRHWRGRLEETHRLPWIPGIGRGHPELLEDHSKLGCRTEIAITSVCHWYISYSCQRIQGFARIGRTETIYDWEVWWS